MKPIHAEKRDSQRPSTAAEMDLHTPLNIPSLEDDIGSSVARNPCASLSSSYAVDVTSNPVSSIVDDDTVVVSGEVLELLTTAGESFALPDQLSMCLVMYCTKCLIFRPSRTRAAGDCGASSQR